MELNRNLSSVIIQALEEKRKQKSNFMRRARITMKVNEQNHIEATLHKFFL